MKLSVFLDYAKAVGIYTTLAICLLYVCQNAAAIGASVWLSEWSNEASMEQRPNNTSLRLGVYATLGIMQGDLPWYSFLCLVLPAPNAPALSHSLRCVSPSLPLHARPPPLPTGLLVMLSAFTMALGGMQAARLLHHSLLHNKMHSPQSFFDTTPSGRILNRFSKDIYVIDEVLAPTILMLFNSLFSSLSTLVVIVVSTPLFAVVIVPLAALYTFVQVR